MRKLIFALLTVVLAIGVATAKESLLDTYNMNRAYEEGNKGNHTGAFFTPDGGCASVKCSINDLPLTFILDTGASIVSLSQTEANFMLKNGYLTTKDFVGKGRFVNADGEISEGTIINLREVDFGGLKLKDVRASVVKNQKAPLLLGQTVLGRLGKIEIDNKNKKLVITPSI